VQRVDQVLEHLRALRQTRHHGHHVAHLLALVRGRLIIEQVQNVARLGKQLRLHRGRLEFGQHRHSKLSCLGRNLLMRNTGHRNEHCPCFDRDAWASFSRRSAGASSASPSLVNVQLRGSRSNKRTPMRSQRCLIPAERFDYPNWESGSNDWWTFRTWLTGSNE
jgi:hypothetical protein